MTFDEIVVKFQNVNDLLPSSKQVNLSRDPEVVVRMLSRGVIRRIIQENVEADESRLRQLLEAATPFKQADSCLEEIWHEEVEAAVRTRKLVIH